MLLFQKLYLLEQDIDPLSSGLVMGFSHVFALVCEFNRRTRSVSLVGLDRKARRCDMCNPFRVRCGNKAETHKANHGIQAIGNCFAMRGTNRGSKTADREER
jgi:hypothetical protein